jgi:Tfp pilus assembly protein PilF/class 3 adenylate cyclase
LDTPLLRLKWAFLAAIDMSSYFAVVFTDLVRHSLAWRRVPRHAMATIIAEYRYLAQSIAGQYGRRHENFTGDGHLFLFESADIAAHFGLKLIAYWKQRRQSLIGVHNAPDLPIRVGCHFGECSQLDDADVWIGRVINVAKRVEASADADSLFVTQTMLELIDLPFYDFNEAGFHELKGDFLPQRQLYRLLSVDHVALAERPVEAMSAEDWFLQAVGMADRECWSAEEELECYRRAIQLRPNYPEAHNNLAILLKTADEKDEASRHYQEALRLWPRYAEAHYNYAIFLESIGDRTGAAAHYRQAIHSRPDYVDARLRYAGLLGADGETAGAREHYQEALRLRPGYAEAHNNYGVFLDKRGEIDAAEQHYLQALEQRPDYAEAHYNYAMLLESITDQAKAEQHYRAALRALPDYAEAHNNLAILLHEKGDLPGAEEHYSAALRLRPRDPETNYNFALLAQAKGDQETADRHFRLSQELIPDAGQVR